MNRATIRVGVSIVLLALCSPLPAAELTPAERIAATGTSASDAEKLRAAIQDLISTFSDRYPDGPRYLEQLDALPGRLEFEQLRRRALLANPLLKDLSGLLFVARKPWPQKSNAWPQLGDEIAMPSNHECNSSLARVGYDNAICLLSPVAPDGKVQTVYRPENTGYVGEIDLHCDAGRMLFTESTEKNWVIKELKTDGTALRQVSQMPDDVDCMDPCYLPNGKIVFGSTACYQSVPCWHGQRLVSNLYVMDAEGQGVRRLCYDQDHDFHPSVLNNGQVMFTRWDYTGISHIFLRELMVMNPDGTGQRAVYGSNSWYPNSLFFVRAIPDSPRKLVAILSGYHGVHRMGQLVVLDTSLGWKDGQGIIKRISGRGEPIRPMIRDNLVDHDWPKFLHPYPLSEKYFLVAACLDKGSSWNLYLADVFDNLVPLLENKDDALLEPVPIVRRERPPAIPERIDLSKKQATVFISDVYAGEGLAGVPRGTITQLRIIAYDFGYPGLAGPNKIGYGGPWEVMRILGTVPVEEDGSASFRVPASTPIAFQALDAQGKAVQLMRSWVTAMPGEVVSCVGCHAAPSEVGAVDMSQSARRTPHEIEPWYGPARGFDFHREVQPVLDRYCTECHDGSDPNAADLRSEADGAESTPLPVGFPNRLHPKMAEATGGLLRYGPAYNVLIHYIRRVGIESDVSRLTPGEFHVDTSPLIQILRSGHHGVELDPESWDRLITWIDLNGPCHGTWGDVFPIPDGVHQRRLELRRLYGGLDDDFEAQPVTTPLAGVEKLKRQPPEQEVALPSRPLTEEVGPANISLDLGQGESIALAGIPAGPLAQIKEPFWIARHEVTNAQFRRFRPSHNSGYYNKRLDRHDGQGLTLDDDRQPALRVSHDDAMAFCRWLSERSGKRVRLPNAAQWEYACRAGSDTGFFYGDEDADFSPWANLADRSFSIDGVVGPHNDLSAPGGFRPVQVSGGGNHRALEGARQSDSRFDDEPRVTAPAGSYRPNAWGLFDMHGNVAEWMRDDFGQTGQRKLVRGGSFFDHPRRATFGFVRSYPRWQRVYNVGFRVVVD